MLNSHRRPEKCADPLDERVATLLAAAAAPSEPGPLPGEAEALAAFRAYHDSPRRSSMLSFLTPARTAAATVVGAGLLLTGGVGAAMAGALPGAAQQTAHDMLAEVGVSVPGPAEASDGHADERGGSAETGETAEVEGAESGKGEEVSELATTTETTGVDKGAEISGFASDGRSRADEASPAPAETTPAQDAPPVEAPNDGGTTTADDATEGASTAGTDTAEESSAGRSGAGSTNRP